MAYADLSPFEVESKRAPKAPPKRKRRTRRTAAPREAAIWPQGEFKGVNNRQQRSIVRMIAAGVGKAIMAGLLLPPQKPKAKPIDPLLRAVEAARRVRELVGRVDISGDSDGASWAKLVAGARGPELHVYYRHGREILADLMAAAEAALQDVGAKIRSMWKRIERARQHGASAWVAVIPLLGDASPTAPVSVTKKSRRRGNLSAASASPP